MERCREKIVQFIRKEYKKTEKNPSIRGICKGLGLTTKALYEVFPGGTPEMCAAAGVPEDEASRAALEKASRALKEKRIKAASDGELNLLREKEKEITADVKRAQTIEKTNRRIGEGELQLASSLEGRRRIFSDPQRMLEFAERTTAFEGLLLDELDVWGSFVDYCKTRDFDLAKKLFQVVGPLEGFEVETEEKELHRYVGLKLEAFLMDRKEEQRQRMMQAKFEDLLRGSTCAYCGRRASDAFMEENELRCPCGDVKWPVWCPNCERDIQFETEKDAFYCHHCKMPFRLRFHSFSGRQ
jgi:hypothetical protein